MSDLKELLENGFITCNSSGDGQYDVKINTRTLKEAHDLHRAIINLIKCENKPVNN